MQSNLVKGATFKAHAPHHIGRDINGKCERHLCPFELVDATEFKGACDLGCPWTGRKE